jgi:hypothetical protein
MKIFIKWFLVIAEFVSKFEVRWRGAVHLYSTGSYYWNLSDIDGTVHSYLVP